MIDCAAIIRDSIDCIEMAKFYGLPLDRSGFTTCVFHGERTASLKFYHDHYHCYGCGAHGDAINFVMQYFSVDFKEAVEKLNMDFNLGLPIGHRPTIRQIRRSQRVTRERKEKQAERERVEAEYQDALSEWTRLDRQSREYAPSRPGEELHPLFVEALEKLQSASQRLRDAEMRMNNVK